MYKYLTLWALLCGSFLFSQSKVPMFYSEMKKPHPNVNEVEALYEKYKEETPKEKIEPDDDLKSARIRGMSSGSKYREEEDDEREEEFRSEYEKEYIEWRKNIEPYLDADGNINYPSEEDFIKDFKLEDKNKLSLYGRVNRVSNDRGQMYNSSTVPYQSTFAGWHYYGPINMFNGNGSRKVMYHANVRSFAQSPTDPNYAACSVEYGTIYVSRDKGKMWHLATKGYNIKGITALAFSGSDRNVIYAGGGRHFVSRDGGVTWDFISRSAGFNRLRYYGGPGNDTSKILAISTDGNPLHDIVLMATSKGLVKLIQTRNPNGSVSYRFEVKLPARVTDIVQRPSHKNEFFALAYDGSKNHMYVYKSIDNGETWHRVGVGNGWYEPNGRMATCKGGRIAVAPSNDNIVYAYLIEGQTSKDNSFWGVYRSDDAGEHWRLPNPNGPGVGNGYNGGDNINLATFPFRPAGTYTQGFYNCAIMVSPKDPDIVVTGGLNAYISRNGGKSFKTFGGYQGPKDLHPDMQTFYQQKNPDGTTDSWITTDGGISYSSDFFDHTEVRSSGLGSDYWGFDLGEYHTNMGGGMYHNGDNYHVSTYGAGNFKRLGGGETATGYILPDNDERHFSFSDYSGIIASPNLGDWQTSAPKIQPSPFEPYAGRGAPYYTQRDYNGNMYYYQQVKKKPDESIIRLYSYVNKDKKSVLLKEFVFNREQVGQEYVVSFSNPLYQYFIMNNRLYASEDGGKTWEERAKPFLNNINIVVSDINPKTIYVLRRYASGNNMLKVSHDGGKTYQSINSPNTRINYKHLINVRGTDVLFLFGNSSSRVYYYMDGRWKEYSEDLPWNFNILEPKIQYRSGEIFMAVTGCGIWTRRLPDDVLAKMNAVKLNIESPKKFSYIKDFSFNVNNISLYYGKNIVKRQWEFPGASQVSGEDTDKPTVVYNKYGRFGVKLTLTDAQGNQYSHYFPNYFTVYPYCSCTVPDVMKDLLGNIEVWADMSQVNLSSRVLTDRFSAKKYNIKGNVEIEEINGQKVLNLKGNNSFIELDKTYQGKTLFVVSKLSRNTSSVLTPLLGDWNNADFHSNGRLGTIFSSQYMSDNSRFDVNNGGRTMINGKNWNYFSTKYDTNNLAVYAMRIANEKSPARVSLIAKDRRFGNRNWQGEIAEVIIFNKKLTDEEMQKVNEYLMTKYAIEKTTADLPQTINGLKVRVDADNVDLSTGVIRDAVAGATYDIVNSSEVSVKASSTNQVPIIKISSENKKAYIQLDKTYQGYTFFVVSRLDPYSVSDFSFLLGSDRADFHSGGKKGSIFAPQWMSDRNRFDSNRGGLTMINNQSVNYASTNFVTGGLTLYTMRVANGKEAARVNSISKDRGYTSRTWQGEIGEVLIYDRRLTDEEIQKINQYLIQKFNIH